MSKPQVWGHVPPRNPDFAGREQLLDQLRRRLQEPGTTAVLPEALHGMGGIGKTQTVVEYLYRHASEYDVVWWIPAEHPARITSSLAELAEKLGIPESPSAQTAVLEALRRGEPPHSRWILVFDGVDNADSAKAVHQFLPAAGHVVVTSRDPAWPDLASPIEVGLFSRAESKQLLSRDNTLTDADADRLAEALGDLPLALHQAAAWLAETGMRVETYLALLKRNLPATRPSNDHQFLVAAACDVSLNRMKNEHPAALQLLQVCALLGSEPISRDLLLGVRGAPVPRALAEALNDPIELDHAMWQVSRYGLARFDHRTNTLQLHRMVRTVLNDNWPRYSAWWADLGKSAAKPRRRVFLSHSHDDRDRCVMALAKSLEDNDVDVWLDCDDMPLGRDIAEEVAEQINSVDAFIVVVSGNTQDSNWVRREVNLAVRRADRDKNFPVICVRLDGVDAPAVLSGIASIKIDSSLDHLPHLENILRAIRRTS